MMLAGNSTLAVLTSLQLLMSTEVDVCPVRSAAQRWSVGLTRSLALEKVARMSTGFTAHTVPSDCFGATAVKHSEMSHDALTVVLSWRRKWMNCGAVAAKLGHKKPTISQ